MLRSKSSLRFTTPWNLKNQRFLMTLKNLELWRFLRGVVCLELLDP